MKPPGWLASYALGTLLFASGSARAQPATLVADLTLEPHPTPGLLFLPSSVEELDGVGHFLHDDGVHGWELWRSDGTAIGTYLLRDLCPGQCGALSFWSVFNVKASAGRLFFAANDGVHGVELWVTDGTALGTHMVRDILPGARSSAPAWFTDSSGTLFFLADDGVHGRELWRSDGTAPGTLLVADLAPGAPNLQIRNLTAGKGRVFFCVGEGDSNAGIWSSDGTAAGTVHAPQVLCAGSAFYAGTPFATLPNGNLIFTGTPAGGPANWELWVSDGTPAGTQMLLDLDGPKTSSTPYSLALTADGFHFVARSSVDPDRRAYWKSDGTIPGTAEIPSPPGFTIVDIPSSTHAVVGEEIFFRGWTPETGYEPFRVAEGAISLVRDVFPGPESSLADPWDNWPYPNQALFAASGGRALFLANDGAHGVEFWTSDGSAAGTLMLPSLTPDASPPGFDPSFSLRPPPYVGDSLLVRVFTPGLGDRLWRVGAAPDELTLLRNIGDQGSSFPMAGVQPYGYFTGGPSCLEASGGRAVFETFDAESWSFQVWGSDGSAAGTELLPIPGSSPYCRSLGATTLLLQNWNGDAELFSSDGTVAGSQSIWTGTSAPSWGRSEPPFVPFGSGAAFAADGALRTTDGATVETLFAVPNFEPIHLAAPDSGWLYVADFELYRSDGQVGPPAPVADLNGDDPSYPGDLVEIDDGHLLFSATDIGTGTELWSTDGTPPGTHLLRDIAAGETSAFHAFEDLTYPSDGSIRVQSFGAGAVFAADDDEHGVELWVTDGTTPGTQLVKDIFPGSYPSTPRNLTRFGDRVFFTAESGLEGLELWVTDGTLAGTAILKNIAPGIASSIPEDLVVRDGVLYFSAWSPDYGREGWMSDGTAAGTVRITDIAPGPASSSPQRFARAGNKLFFSATDQIHGYELWAIAFEGGSPLFVDGFEIGSALRWSAIEP